MSESAMFKPEYATSLPLAPKIFHADEVIHTSDMPTPSGVWKRLPGYIGEDEVSPETPLPPIGRVVMVFQLKKGGGGHIRARFEDDKAKWLTEYHFRSNPRINS